MLPTRQGAVVVDGGNELDGRLHVETGQALQVACVRLGSQQAHDSRHLNAGRARIGLGLSAAEGCWQIKKLSQNGQAL